MARFRAVVMIHPAGLGGSPPAGHRSSAVVNASCTASSALSRSPRTRGRTATARPYSARNTRWICALLSMQWPHLDRQQADPPGHLPGPAQPLAQVRPLDYGEPAEVLLALD